MAKSIKSQVNPWFTDDTVGSSDARAFGVAAFSAKPNSLYDVEGGIIPNSGHLGGFGIKSAGSAGNPKVTVYGGRLVLPVANQHAYICLWPTAQDVQFDVPHATNPRIDLLVARVRSDELGDPTKDHGFYVETIAGTPATTPQEPTAPSNAMKLWMLKVEPNKGITSVTDYRTYTRAVGGVRPSKNDNNRAGSYPYDLRITPRGDLDMWSADETKPVWMRIGGPNAWTQFTPTLRYKGGGSVSDGQVNLGQGGVARANYQLTGRTLIFQYLFAYGTRSDAGVGDIYTLLPPGVEMWPAHQYPQYASSTLQTTDNPNVWFGYAECAEGNRILPLFPASGTNFRCWYHRNADSSYKPGTGIPQLPNIGSASGTMNIWGSIQIRNYTG